MAAQAGQILMAKDLQEVYKAVYPARAKWRPLGLELGLQLEELDDIEDLCSRKGTEEQEVGMQLLHSGREIGRWQQSPFQVYVKRTDVWRWQYLPTKCLGLHRTHRRLWCALILLLLVTLVVVVGGCRHLLVSYTLVHQDIRHTNSYADLSGQVVGWNLSHLPDSTSPLVMKEKDALRAINQLDRTLYQLGNLSGMAYYAAVEYGDHSLQQQVKGICQDVRTLQENYSIKFDTLKSHSIEAVSKLEAAFEFLIQGDKDKAVSTLQAVSLIGQRLVHAAGELRHEASDHQDKLVTVLEKTRQAKSKREGRKEDYEEKKRELQLEKDKLKKQQRETAEAAKRAKEEFEKFMREANREERIIAGRYGLVEHYADKLFGSDAVMSRLSRKKAAIEKALHQQRLYQQAKQELTSLEGKLKKLDKNINLIDKAFRSLHEAMGEFQSLSLIMDDVTTFWKSVRDQSEYLVHSLTLTDDGMSSYSKVAAKIWETTQQLYAKLLALNAWISYDL